MKRRIILVAVVGLVAALVVALLIPRDREPGGTISIGGFRVSVLGVASHGKPFTTEKMWHPWARKLLPGSFKQWIPSPRTFSPWGASTGSVLVVIQVTPSPGTSAATLPWDGYRSESLAGDMFEMQDRHLKVSVFAPAADDMRVVMLNSFPRRDPAFHLRLLAKDGTTVGVLRVPNPTPGPFPVWTPRPLPQTATNGGGVLTLTALASVPNDHLDANYFSGLPVMASLPISRLSPAFELRTSEPLWENAKVVSTTVADATGNERDPLPRTESAWRIRAFVHRSDPSAFLPEEKFVLTSLAPTNAVVAGVAMRFPGPAVHETIGGGNESADLFTGKFAELREPQVTVETDTESDDAGVRLSCVAFDQAGNPLAQPALREPVSPIGLMRRIRFTLPNWPKGPKEWSRVEILVSRPKVFEFLVNPADVKTNTAAR